MSFTTKYTRLKFIVSLFTIRICNHTFDFVLGIKIKNRAKKSIILLEKGLWKDKEYNISDGKKRI